MLFCASFFLVEWLNLPLLTNPEPWLKQPGFAVALLGVGLLLADVFIPVPSSLIMIAMGSAFGVVGGTLLSLLGAVGATLIGFGLGRFSTAWVARFVSSRDGDRARETLQKWGPLAVLASRPVPILAESISILAGTTKMSWSSVTVAACIGSLPATLLYAITGSTALALDHLPSIFGFVIICAALFWFLFKRWGRVMDPTQKQN